jgi:beta-glucosidase
MTGSELLEIKRVTEAQAEEKDLVLEDLCAAAALQPAPMTVDAAPPSPCFRFPEGFLFGAATSAHQVEGNCTNNDWWDWEQQGRVPDRSGIACDHYRRFRDDFDLAHALGHNTHRFSIEWSRIEPEEGSFSSEAIAHYRAVLEALHARGIEPILTLHHFTLPLWLARKGGWENPEIVGLFGRFTARMADAYGDRVRWWITLNEPVAYAFKSYVIGEWPPGKRDYGSAARVVRNMLHAHVRAYHAIHARRKDAMVSAAHHVLALAPDDPRRWLDHLSVRARGYLVNHLFLRALVRGSVRIPGLLWEALAGVPTLDFLALNYYTRDFVRNTGLHLPGLLGNGCARDHRLHVGARNGLGWEVYPEGLGTLLQECRRYSLPILISENGVSTDRDADRWAFIYMHLWQAARALADGVPVLGYLYWSLIDNFEWAEGYRARFGLVHVDYATQRRTVRPSGWHFKEVIRRNQL